jgi:hypothetical protein
MPWATRQELIKQASDEAAANWRAAAAAKARGDTAGAARHHEIALAEDAVAIGAEQGHYDDVITNPRG